MWCLQQIFETPSCACAYLQAAELAGTIQQQGQGNEGRVRVPDAQVETRNHAVLANSQVSHLACQVHACVSNDKLLSPVEMVFVLLAVMPAASSPAVQHSCKPADTATADTATRQCHLAAAANPESHRWLELAISGIMGSLVL